MKKFTAILLAVAALAIMFCSCEPTPDAVAKGNEVTLDNIDWTIQIEGADKTEYTIADAKAHELTKIMASVKSKTTDGRIEPTTFICQGVKVSEMLADLGKPDATKITVTGTDLYDKEVEYTFTADQFNNDKAIIGWIANKKSVLENSQSYVGILFDTALNVEGSRSITKIVIE